MKQTQIMELKLTGKVRVTATDPRKGRVVRRLPWQHNLVVTDGKEIMAGLLIAETDYEVGLTYCAIGTDSTAPAVADALLVAEVGRKAITSKSRSGVVATLSTFYTAGDSTFNIQELGLFGVTASGSADSGKLFARALVPYENSGGLVDLTFDWVITISA